MNRGDAAREAGPGHVLEPGGPDPFGQSVGGGENGDGGRQIIVGGIVPGDPSPDTRENLAEVRFVEETERLPVGGGELEDDQWGRRPEQAGKFAQSVVDGGEVAHAEGDHGAIDRLIAEGLAKGVAAGGHDRQSGGFGQAMNEHGKGEIGGDDAAAEAVPGGQFHCEIQSAGASIEEQAIRYGGRHQGIDGEASPALIDVEAEQVVEEVVPWCDGAEHSLHRGGLVGALLGSWSRGR